MGCGVSSQTGAEGQSIPIPAESSTDKKSSVKTATIVTSSNSSTSGTAAQRVEKQKQQPRGSSSTTTSLLTSGATDAVAACTDGTTTPLTVEGFTAATTPVIKAVTGGVDRVAEEVSSDVAETQAAISALQEGDASQAEGLIDSLMSGVGAMVGAVNAAKGGKVDIQKLKLPDAEAYSKAENLLKNYSVLGQVGA